MAGVYRSRAERERLITLYHASGLNAEEFAAREGVGLSTFYQWLARLKRRSPQVTAPVPVARVICRNAMSPNHGFGNLPLRPSGIVLEQGRTRVQLAVGFEPSALAAVLDVLDTRSCST